MSKLDSHLSMLTPRGQFVKFDADALIRLDPLTRWTIYEKQRLIGGASIDEIRNRENMPPLPNGGPGLHAAADRCGRQQISTPAIRSAREERLRLVREERDHA
jgi:hypothetical protein